MGLLLRSLLGMNSTSNAEAALLAPNAAAKSGMAKTSLSSSVSILLFARKVKSREGVRAGKDVSQGCQKDATNRFRALERANGSSQHLSPAFLNCRNVHLRLLGCCGYGPPVTMPRY